MNHPASSLTIQSIPIKQDDQGRYSLGDLYRASGGEGKNKPSQWLRRHQVKELVHELELGVQIYTPNSAADEELEAGINAYDPEFDDGLEGLISPPNFDQIRPVNTVRGHGITDTYVVKELVYAYAMWISPAFHLHVIRAYDAMISGQLDKFTRPARQHEKYWFVKNPHWESILPLALQGLRCTEIARQLGISAGRVSRAIRRMIEVGLMDPAKRLSARFKPDAASRQMQLPFFATWGQRPLAGGK